MKHQPNVEAIFGSSAWFYLPKLLNTYKVSVDAFQKMQFNDKPELVRALLMYFRKYVKPDDKAVIRMRRWDGSGTYITLLNLANVNHRDTSAINSTATAFRKMIIEILNRSHIYDHRLTEGTPTVCSTWEVRSTLKATFSFNDTDWEHCYDPYLAVDCPDCGRTEVVLADTEEDALEYVTKFEHLTGPYCRCNGCDAVVRPDIRKATSFPEGSWGENDHDWDDYVEQLAYVVEEAEQHMKAVFPDRDEPDHLEAYIGHADWRGRDASAKCELNGKSIAETIRVNGEMLVRDGELHCYADGKVVITCVLAHHDATSSVTITPAWICDLDRGTPISQDEMEQAAKFAEIAQELLCGPDKVFEYSKGEPFKKVSRHCLAADIRQLMYRLGYESGPEDMNDLMDNPTEKPELDLIVYTLFTMEDQVLINKLAPSLILMQAVFTARALKLHLALEESDAT